jgi:uncharacterized protein (DUF1499 family)
MIFLIYLLIIVLAILVAGRLGLFAGKQPSYLGVTNGKLAAPDLGKQNAVCSHTDGTGYHSIAPIRYDGSQEQARAKLIAAIAQLNGTSIVRQDPNYLYAQSQTKWMRYIDDVEFLFDDAAKIIHVRSASRLGRKDFGVNRARIEYVRKLMSS